MMHNQLDEMFENNRKNGKTIVIPFLPASWPESNSTIDIVNAAVKGGASAIEIGWPFSDPMGDGPVNQRAYDTAIQNGCTGEVVIDLASQIRTTHPHLPIIIMGYFNPLLAYGPERWAKDAQSAGINGLICVDLPPQEALEIAPILTKHSIHTIFLLAPTSTDDRIELVSEYGSGMIYCVSVVGITGARKTLSNELPVFIEQVRTKTDIPLAIGFGISERSHVVEVNEIADAAVVGSAFIQAIAQADRQTIQTATEDFIATLTSGRES